ncbi:MAG: hypothetical protein EAX86_02680 [Candidatus Heimdallarchaeota archaeon]|nr:hypothetical protein [Candidatus Heimdallarchaeota archaeon]
MIFRENIYKIINVIEKKYSSDLYSIILFGSLTFPQSNLGSTDIDLVIVIKNESREVFQEIKHYLSLLDQTQFSQHRTLSFNKSLERATGMFVNFFACKLSDFQNRCFHKVFGLNRFVSTILAPQTSVWISLWKQHQILWGEDPFKTWLDIPKFTKLDLYRSFLMNFLLALGSIVLYPLSRSFVKYSMEAMKWSLFTWRNVQDLPIIPIDKLVWYYTKQKLLPLEMLALRYFVEYRKTQESTVLFPALTFYFVICLHLFVYRI